MQTKYITIEFTADEIETLGDSLCLTIKRHLEGFAGKDLDVDDYIQEYRGLLYDLTSAGYQVWMDADTGLLHGKHTVDVDEWIKYEKARALAVTPKKKAKKKA